MVATLNKATPHTDELVCSKAVKSTQMNGACDGVPETNNCSYGLHEGCTAALSTKKVHLEVTLNCSWANCLDESNAGSQNLINSIFILPIVRDETKIWKQRHITQNFNENMVNALYTKTLGTKISN